MQLKKYSTKRKGDIIEVHAQWMNKFRKAAYIGRIDKTDEAPLADDSLLFEGDVKDVHGMLFGFATIAWDMGWRPAGLLETTMKHIQEYKISGGKK
jgi:hypothetical protein